MFFSVMLWEQMKGPKARGTIFADPTPDLRCGAVNRQTPPDCYARTASVCPVCRGVELRCGRRPTGSSAAGGVTGRSASAATAIMVKCIVRTAAGKKAGGRRGGEPVRVINARAGGGSSMRRGRRRGVSGARRRR